VNEPSPDALQQARTLFEQGVREAESGQLSRAESCFSQALELVPERPSVLMNLGVVRAALGRTTEAIDLLRRAAELAPEAAETWAHLGASYAETGQYPLALAALDRTLALHPQDSIALQHKASVLRELGRWDESAQCLQRLHQQGGGDEFTRYMLAAVQHAQSDWTQEPPAPPAGYVAQLFDRYADDFSSHLSQLDYRAPDILVKAAKGSLSQSWEQVLDLGCGTGLVGQCLQGLALHVDGVDLSASMVNRALESGHYRRVWQADIHDAMEQVHQAGHRYDLIVSADVFIYVGALERMFELATRVLRAGGGLTFSLEEWAAGPEAYVLRPSLRYAHSLAYIQRLASDHGLRVLRTDRGLLRHDHGQAITGLFCVLQKNG
jgi:predicted TPR repeat methyltransferase